ncbi:unnamed protein product, partial [Ectocarpus sp. 12 AP-2014]
FKVYKATCPTGGTEITHQPFYDPVCGYHSAAGFPYGQQFFCATKTTSSTIELI